jgi:hypothetical protein
MTLKAQYFEKTNRGLQAGLERTKYKFYTWVFFGKNALCVLGENALRLKKA